MKKALLLCLTTVLVLSIVTPASAATATKWRFYQGTTSQGGYVGFATAVVRGNTRLLWFEYEVDVTCPDSTEWTFGTGTGWGYRGPILVDGAFEFEDNWVFEALSADGLVGGGMASGTLTESFATLTQDGTDSQFCTTGALEWTAQKMKLRGTPLPTAPSRTLTVTSKDGSQQATLLPLAG